MKATKRITRLCSILLAVVIVMAMSVSSAFAATITINNTQPGETYNAYKLFDVSTSGSGESASYSYSTTDSSLVNTLKEIGLTFTTSADGKTYYVKIDAAGNNFVTDATIDTDGTMTAAELAAALNGKVNDLGDPVATETVADKQTSITLGDGQGEGDVESLAAGYYFVTSSVGSLCFLQTNDSAVNINEKNEAPEVDKKADTPNEDGQTEGTVQIGDTVNYTINITAKPGAENYVLHDNMSDGLTLNAEYLYADDDEDDEQQLTPIAVEGITVATDDETDPTFSSLRYGIDYTVNLEPTDAGCDFEVIFTEAYLDTITENTDITVTYSATVNENAKVGEMNNHAILDYGDNSSVDTEGGSVNVYTYAFTLTKTDTEGAPLTGAEFSLYDQKEGGDAISFVDLGNGSYRVATEDEIKAFAEWNSQASHEPGAQAPATVTTTIAVNNEGKATIAGLAGKSYWLEETKAPAGYNKLSERKEVTFTEVKVGEDDQPVAEGQEGTLSLKQSYLNDATVENATGSELPSTGGMGTTAIYIVGGVLVAGAAVLLVTRRRMHA